MSTRWKHRPGDRRQAQLNFDAAPPPPPAPRRPAASEPSRRARQRDRVYAFIRSRMDYGATADEVCAAMGLFSQSATPRIRELTLEGLIVRTERTRRTRCDTPAAVYVAAEYHLTAATERRGEAGPA